MYSDIHLHRRLITNSFNQECRMTCAFALADVEWQSYLVHLNYVIDTGTKLLPITAVITGAPPVR